MFRRNIINHYYNVFTPGGVPTVTYNPRSNYKLEDKVMQAKKNISKLMIITGPTKSGKTVLLEKVFSRNEAVWIDGGAISDTEDSFWETVVSTLGIPIEYEAHVAGESSFEVVVGAEGKIKVPVVASATASVSGSYSSSSGDGHSSKTTLSYKAAALRYLDEYKPAIIIDDFHYIKNELQALIVRALKAPIMHGLPVVIIAIPNRKFDVVKVEREMTGRVELFEIPRWNHHELSVISKKGFDSLNVILTNNITNRLTKEAMGSPHLMQEFCRAICMKYHIEQTVYGTVFLRPSTKLEPLFREIAKNTGRSLFNKLARGPRQRSDRKDRRLKNGQVTDIYGVVMAAFVRMKPNLDSVNYDVFRGYIRDVIDDELPQMHEISRVLDQITKISYDSGASTPVIDWSKDEDVITITDPFFAFYLRWNSDQQQYAFL